MSLKIIIVLICSYLNVKESIKYHIVTSSLDGNITIWDELNINPLVVYLTKDYQDSGVNKMAVNLQNNIIVSALDDHSVQLFSINDQKNRYKTLNTHKNRILSLAISNSGRQIISGSEDTTAIVQDVLDNILMQSIHGHSSSINAVAISEDEKQVQTASASGTANQVDLLTGSIINFQEYSQPLTAMVVTKCGRYLLTGANDGSILVWETSSGALVKMLNGHKDAITSIEINGISVFSASKDHSIILWNVTSGKPIKKYTGHRDEVTSIKVSVDLKQMVSGSKDKSAILWDVATSSILRLIRKHSDVVTSVSFLQLQGIEKDKENQCDNCIHG